MLQRTQVAMNPHNTFVLYFQPKPRSDHGPSLGVFDVKCLLSHKFDNPEVQPDIKHFPFKVFFQGRRALYQSRAPR
jgi:heat shock 70kDa protein 1/2/6/8